MGSDTEFVHDMRTMVTRQAAVHRVSYVPSIRTALWGALCLFAAFAADPVLAQGGAQQQKPLIVPQPSDLLKSCPPGTRIELLLSSSTLFVDPRWLDAFTLHRIFDQSGPTCPTRPIRLDQIIFDAPILDLLGVSTGLGVIATYPHNPFVRVDVFGIPAKDNRARDLQPPNPADKPATDTPWVEDLTKLPLFKKDFGPDSKQPASRLYRLHYPEEGQDLRSATQLSCGGEAQVSTGRSCRTPFGFRYAGMFISYWIEQGTRPIPDRAQTTSTDIATEPGALVDFDARLRVWLKGLQQRQ